MAGIAGGRVRRFVGLLTVCFSLAVLLLHTVAVPTRSDAPPLNAAAPPHTHAPARTNRTAPATVEEAILRHCDTVWRVVEEKWLPLARTDPATGDPTVHIAFWGDSISFFEYSRTVVAMHRCLGERWVSNLNETTLPTDLCLKHRTDFSPRATGPAPGGRRSAFVPRIVVSFHRHVLINRLAEDLQAVYTSDGGGIGKKGRRAEAVQWPRYPSLPAAQVLYMCSGAWYVFFEQHAWNEEYARRKRILITARGNVSWPDTVVRAHRLIRETFTRPFREVIAGWRAGRWFDEAAAAPRANVSPFRPPDHLILASPISFNCSGTRRWLVRDDLTVPQNVRKLICESTAFPMRALIHSLYVETLSRSDNATGRGAGRNHRAIRTTLVDGDAVRDYCATEDGTHLSDNVPQCRERAASAFWGIFLTATH